MLLLRSDFKWKRTKNKNKKLTIFAFTMSAQTILFHTAMVWHNKGIDKCQKQHHASSFISDDGEVLLGNYWPIKCVKPYFQLHFLKQSQMPHSPLETFLQNNIRKSRNLLTYSVQIKSIPKSFCNVYQKVSALKSRPSSMHSPTPLA